MKNSCYAKQTFAFNNPLPSAVFCRVSRGITNSDLQAQKFTLSETAQWEIALDEGCLYLGLLGAIKVAEWKFILHNLIESFQVELNHSAFHLFLMDLD